VLRPAWEPSCHSQCPLCIYLLPVPPEARPQDGQRGAHLQRVQHQVR
jgi:hypothetical protein